jgi:hypothetical protein
MELPEHGAQIPPAIKRFQNLVSFLKIPRPIEQIPELGQLDFGLSYVECVIIKPAHAA